jgi:chromosome partitioning protein
MNVLTVAARKGGVGKSTLAIALAVEAAKAGVKVALLDLDPQCSAVDWSDCRGVDMPTVVALPARRLEKQLQIYENEDYGLVLVDTPPHADGDILTAAKCAHLVLIPTRPSIVDIRAIGGTLDILEVIRDVPSWVVLNQTSPRPTSTTLEAQSAITELGAKLCPVTLAERIAHQHAAIVGQSAAEYEPDGRAAHETRHLWRWVTQQLPMEEAA